MQFSASLVCRWKILNVVADKDELHEIEDDPLANEADSEHAAAMRSIAADEQVISSFSPANHMVSF